MINALIILYILRYIPDCPLWIYMLLVIEIAWGLMQFAIGFLKHLVLVEVQDRETKDEQ